MAKLDLEWLNVFVEVYRTQSVSRAAERLDMAQANASIALNKLRRHFADRLFSRTSRGMEPTPYAQRIYPEVVASVDRLVKIFGTRASFDAANTRRQFRICMTDISEIVVLPTLVNHLRRVAPGVRIVPTPGHVPGHQSFVVDTREGRIVIAGQAFQDAAMYARDLYAWRLDRSGSPHPEYAPWVARLRVSPDLLPPGRVKIGACWVDGEPYNDFDAQGLTVKLPAPGSRDPHHHLARQRLTLLEGEVVVVHARIVAQTELLVIVPRRLGEALAQHERVRMFEPPVSLPAFAVKQHWHERFHADAGNAWLRRTLAELLGR